jgi:hypothetical protein
MSLTKRKPVNSLEMVEWMLAIDFDAVEIKSSRLDNRDKAQIF